MDNPKHSAEARSKYSVCCTGYSGGMVVILLTPQQKKELQDREAKEKQEVIRKYNKRRNDIWENQLMKQWEML